jgi:hypothetical protein
MLTRILERAGAPELAEAVQSGALTLSWDFMSLDADTDTQIQQYAERLRLLLASPNEHLLLDQRMADLARGMVNERQVTPHELALLRAARSRVGTGLVSRLPAFPDASVSSVLEARSELADALSAYRAGVARISGKIRSGPLDVGMDSEVADLWRDEVQPAVNWLRSDLSHTRIAREAALHLGTDAKTALAAASMFFGVETLTEVHHLAAATVASLPVVGKAVSSAYGDSAGRRESARRHEFFYLLQLDQQLE